jgi:ABC-type dipeptide/oligopeptide/nickel transport system permease component
VAIGTAAIIVLLVSNIRLRRLRQIELRGLAGTTEAMLDQSIERVESTLRYRRFALVAIVPAIVIGNMVASSAERSLGSWLDSVRGIPHFVIAWAAFWLTVLAGMVLFVTLSLRRGRRELERLKAMRDAYRQEGEL